MYKSYIQNYLTETIKIAETIDIEAIDMAINILADTKKSAGRLFILGVGGSAANASHAVNDFRKLAGIETYAPTDNVSELTARTNDEGFETIFTEWLKTSRLGKNDTVLVFSVGGGSDHTSLNITKALEYGKDLGCKIISVVSRDGGTSKRLSDACVMVPVVADERITPHAEGWQGIVWHLVVNALCSVGGGTE